MIALGYAGFLLGGLAVAVPVVLHLIRNKPKTSVPFPAFDFLEKTVISLQARNLLRKRLVLLLRCLAIFLLALAFCLPYFPVSSPNPDIARVILIDNSMSMLALPYKNYMHMKAFKEISQTGVNSPAIVGVAGHSTLFNGEFTADASTLKKFYLDHASSACSGKLGEALMQADKLLFGIKAKEKEIVILTDFQKLPWQDLPQRWNASPGVKLRIVSPKQPGFRNIWLHSLVQEKLFTEGMESLPFRLTVHNDLASDFKGDLLVYLNGKKVTVQTVTLQGGDSKDFSFNIKPYQQIEQKLFVELKVEDDIREDNYLYYVIKSVTPPKIALSPCSPANQFIRCCFSSAGKQQVAKTCSLAYTDIPDAELSILSSAEGMDAQKFSNLEESLRQGNNLVVIWDRSFQMRSFLEKFGIVVKQDMEEKVHYFSTIDFSSPLFKKFLEVKLSSLYAIPFHSPPRVRLPEQAQVIASFTGGTPAISEIPAGKGSILFIASSLDRSRSGWPLHASFLPVMREILLQYGKQNSDCESFYCGCRLNLGENESVFHKKQKLGGAQAFLFEPGFYHFRTGTKQQLISVNADISESFSETMPNGFNLKKYEQPNKEPSSNMESESNKASRKSYWRVLLGAALLALLSSLILANRTTL